MIIIIYLNPTNGWNNRSERSGTIESFLSKKWSEILTCVHPYLVKKTRQEYRVNTTFLLL